MMKRIVIVGTAGSGKTRLAQQLSQRLALPHIELDALFWEPGWVESDLLVFRKRVEEALSVPGWVADGNYSRVRDLTWGSADTLIWLDLPLPLIIWRLLIRSLRRIFRQDRLWGTNRETFRDAFLSKGSLLLYALTSNPRHRRMYPLFFILPEFSHLRIFHLRSTRQVDQFLLDLDLYNP